MLLTSSFLGDLVTLVVTLIVIAIVYLKWTYQYWSRKNVPYLEPQIPYGNVPEALRGKEHIGVGLARIYKEMKNRGWKKHGGIFLAVNPNYFPLDLDLVRNIMTKDFQYFMDRNVYYNKKDPLQQHLLNLTGDKWKNLRAKLTPTFTSGKMKMMFQVMVDCEPLLQKKMDDIISTGEPIDIKEILARFTTNVIGSCAFGLDFQALEDENSPFRAIGKAMFTSTKWHSMKRRFTSVFPEISRFLNISLARKQQSEFILNMVQDIIDYREKTNTTRNDFMQLMINMKKNPDSDQGLTMDELASQCVVFFAAGFETSSTLMTFALYELSKNQDIQEKLRKEIRSVLSKYDDKITYDSIQDMKYLDQVVDETLRMHPPAAQLNRKCVKDYKIPGEDLVIEKGTIVTMSILGIHHDPEYYPNPSKFDPERFNDENRKKLHNFAHMPFGEGPRNCIGMRFGLLQSKMGLVALLRNYNFTVNKKTREPIFYKPNSPVLAVSGELWLNAKRV